MFIAETHTHTGRGKVINAFLVYNSIFFYIMVSDTILVVLYSTFI